MATAARAGPTDEGGFGSTRISGSIPCDAKVPRTGAKCFGGAGESARRQIKRMGRRELVEEALTRSVIGCFFDVYNTLKFGLLESLYSRALEWELLSRGHQVAREFGVRVSYKGIDLGIQRLDLVVDEKLVVEIKSTQDLHKAAVRQVYKAVSVRGTALWRHTESIR
jgi:GxxExxY protein